MLEKHYLHKVEPKPGKFRSFLLVALKRFIADQRARAKATKRGGDRKVLPFDFEMAEGQYMLEPVYDVSPERLFERSWALTILEQTMTRLETELASVNKQGLFDALKVYLAGETGSVPYRDVATRLDMAEDAVKAAVYRLRTRYRETLRNEIAQTVATHDQIDEEIHDLFAALAD